METLSPAFWRKMADVTKIALGGALVFCGIAAYKQDDKFHRKVTVPLMQQLDPETAHKVSVWALKHRLLPRTRHQPSHKLHSRCMGLEFKTPVGLAAGFDKDGEAVEGINRLGFGFVEIGSVTPEPQPGNPKPRVFRLLEDQSVINRYGFNSAGHAAVVSNLKELPAPGERSVVLGVNLGKNKTATDHVAEYRQGVKILGPYADYLVVNVSSPNTPGLRGLQSGGLLGELLDGVLEERRRLPGGCCPPLLVKLAPDLTPEELKQICSIAIDRKIDGLIISNTTIDRPSSLQSVHRSESGGLSGKALEHKATEAIRLAATYTRGSNICIIGVGGVSDGAGVYAKLRAGASLVQLYTAFVYAGPGIIRETEAQLLDLMTKDGFSSVSEVIGKDL